MSIRQLYHDQIETLGAVKRIFFHFQTEKEREWHYFGTDPVEVPPTEAGTVFEYPVVQLPQDLDDLPQEFQGLLKDLGLTIGLARENIET